MQPTIALLRFSIVMLIVIGSGLVVSSCLRAESPDASLIAQAVQATLTAMPTATRTVPVHGQTAQTAPLAAPAQHDSEVMRSIPTANSPTPVSQPSTAGHVEEVKTMERAVAQLINELRRMNGLATLTLVDELTLAARRHSLDMAHHGLTQHTGSDGSSGGQRIREAGYQWAQWDETIAWGALEPAEVVDWFLNSETHRAVLLSSAVADIGVGFVANPDSQWMRYWTVDFASRGDQAYTTAPAAHPELALSLAAPTPTVTVEQPEESSTVAPVQPGCPTTSQRQYDLIPMEGVDQTHADYLHADLNLAQRGFVSTAGELSLIEIAGPTDPGAPQLAGLFADPSGRWFSAVYQTYDWDWSCGNDGCRGGVLDQAAVALLGIVTIPGEEIRPPSRDTEIYGGGYSTVVLYADEKRITLAYTRDGTVANGYAVHLEQLCVDANLLAAYRTANGAGRSYLPALHSNQALGEAAGTEIIVAVRDRGSFLDPRSRKDWWRTADATLLPNGSPQ